MGVIQAEVSLPHNNCLIIAASGDHVLIVVCELDLGNMTTVPHIGIVLGFVNHARVLKEFNSAEVICRS